MANQMMVIRPYRQHGTGVFDDPARDLVQEPFVGGVPEIIDEMVADIKNANDGFRMLFSADPFPGYQLCANWLDPEMNGWWYEADGMEGMAVSSHAEILPVRAGENLRSG